MKFHIFALIGLLFAGMVFSVDSNTTTTKIIIVSAAKDATASLDISGGTSTAGYIEYVANIFGYFNKLFKEVIYGLPFWIYFLVLSMGFSIYYFIIQKKKPNLMSTVVLLFSILIFATYAIMGF